MVVREPRVQAPSLDAYSDMPLFNTKAVVRQTNIPAPTLRAWERRYGILAPRRGENDYRLYSERDIATVTWLRERVESGLTISQAIALLRSLEPARSRRRTTRMTMPTMPTMPTTPAHSTQEPSHQHLTAEAFMRFSLDEMIATLLRQFANLDEQGASHTIAQALAVHSIEDVCLAFFAPALHEIGRLWAAGDVTVTVEHFASALVRAQLDSLYRTAATGGEFGSLTLVGCAPGEQHELGSLMLALFLRRAGLRVAYLGQNIELQSLLTTIHSTKPACLLLSATLPQQVESLAEVGARLRALESAAPLFYCGGAAFVADPARIELVHGCYLALDAHEAAQEIKKRLSR
ncbi:MAG: B12-binding domain-containing protein [Ktedonobacterales bacterium]